MAAPAGSTGTSRAVSTVTTLLFLLAIVPLLVKAPAAARFTASILTYPFQVDDSEGVVLSEAQLLARGTDPYQPVRPDFFTAAPYTPIFTGLNAVVFVFAPFTFKFGRGLALLATIFTAGVLGWLLRWRTGSFAIATWGVAMVLTLNLVNVWAGRARPDPLALGFNLAGLALAWRAWPGGAWASRARERPLCAKDWWEVALVAFLFGLGFYTKQTLLAAPVAVGAYLVLIRPRLAFAFAAVYGALIVIPFVLLDTITRGGFYQHIVAFHSSWSWTDFWRLWSPFIARYWPLVSASLALVAVAGSTMIRRRSDGLALPAIYLVLALVSALGAGTHGGNHNHFVEGLVAATLGAGLVAGRLARARQGPSRLAAGALLLALALASLGEAGLAGSNWLARDFRTPRAAEREGWAQLAAYVTNDPGPVYSDNVGLLLVAGKAVRYTDPFTLTYAAATGQWDQRGLVRRIEAGEFSLIALRYDIFAESGAAADLTPEMYAAIRARYRLVERNVLYVYRPR